MNSQSVLMTNSYVPLDRWSTRHELWVKVFDRFNTTISVNTRFYRILSMMKTGGKTTALSQPLYLMKVPWFKLKPREWFEYYFKPLSMSDLALWRTRISLMTTNTESLSKKKLYFLNFSVLSEWSYAKHTVYYTI